MELLNELLNLTASKTSTQLFEARNAFDDVDVIKVDPDRDGSHDIALKLLPTLTRIAYTYLLDDKNKHEKQHGPKSDGEDAYNFAFTKDELKDRLEDLVKHLKDRLDDKVSQDFDEVLKDVSKDFKEPLED